MLYDVKNRFDDGHVRALNPPLLEEGGGVWGRPSESTAEQGERFLQWGTTAVVNLVRENGATTVYFETLVSPKLARTVARETGAKTAVLDPIEGLTPDETARGADYFSVMRSNLAHLRQGLGCS